MDMRRAGQVPRHLYLRQGGFACGCSLTGVQVHVQGQGGAGNGQMGRNGQSLVEERARIAIDLNVPLDEKPSVTPATSPWSRRKGTGASGTGQGNCLKGAFPLTHTHNLHKSLEGKGVDDNAC